MIEEEFEVRSALSRESHQPLMLLTFRRGEGMRRFTLDITDCSVRRKRARKKRKGRKRGRRKRYRGRRID
jgi:hypothetical protein